MSLKCFIVRAEIMAYVVSDSNEGAEHVLKSEINTIGDGGFEVTVKSEE